jgi:hypothetical protein
MCDFTRGSGGVGKFIKHQLTGEGGVGDVFSATSYWKCGGGGGI